jgi:chromosome segregation ATPase
LEAETKKSERLDRDRSRSVKNLAEAESGARRQGAELSNRDGTIATLTDKLEKVTRDSIKKSTTINELQRDVDKKAAKVEELRTQRTGLRNRLDEQASLLQTAVDERDSELDNLRALLSISSEDIAALEATANQSRDDKERLQLRYTEAEWRWQRCKTNLKRHGFKQEPTERRRHPCLDR